MTIPKLTALAGMEQIKLINYSTFTMTIPKLTALAGMEQIKLIKLFHFYYDNT